MQLEDWLDDLCVRFIINLPEEEANNVERLCFQVEEAQWFYEDFVRPLDPRLPSLSLKAFSLRIFQHCPVFRQWEAHHRTQAFADFMAYKQRVPVRGAIMLNQAMDKVVLVKGWKKGANWSFPRGKINKGEDDLDCAVREVYEETGFDIAAAGLVKDESAMKSIDITMREQHMRLYVFRGVPEDTHFEPRTRKEISKIEWYRLTDLPTLGKHHKHADGSGSGNGASGPSPNKFYMVAPFLGPLKKWIQQQRKKEGIRHSSSLAAPPMIAEESADDQPASHQPSQTPSDLPEVTAVAPNSAAAPAQLAQLFGIGVSQPQPQPQPQQPHLPQTNAAKSNALLSLLKGPPAAATGIAATPNPTSTVPAQIDQLQPAALANENEPWPPGRPGQEQYPSFPQFQRQVLASTGPVTAPPPPPYQLTGDPQFARVQQQGINAPSAVPPASALPKLTHHTKTLLDIFSTKPPTGPSGPSTQQPQSAPSARDLLDAFQGSSRAATGGQHQAPLAPSPAAAFLGGQPKQPTFANVVSALPLPAAAVKSDSASAPTTQLAASTAQQKGLLSLFGGARAPSSAAQAVPRPRAPAAEEPQARVELAATPEHQPKNDNALLTLLRKQKADQAVSQPHPGSTAKEGKTSANMSGPLDQPNFDVVAKAHKVDPNGSRRSPVAADRTLFDPKHPNQPTRIKVMARPESPRQPAPPPKSPRAPKTRVPSSPKRPAKSSQKEHQAKPFQPQILKRPQTAEGPAPAPAASASSEPAVRAAQLMSRQASAEKPLAQDSAKTETSPSIAPVDPQKQALLSLFGGRAASPSSTSTGKTVQSPARIVSPLSMSQIVSSRGDVPLSAVDPVISTRSRVESVVSTGSAASIATGTAPSRPALEKRQTAAEDKAFLLGMLGKIAQEQS